MVIQSVLVHILDPFTVMKSSCFVFSHGQGSCLIIKKQVYITVFAVMLIFLSKYEFVRGKCRAGVPGNIPPPPFKMPRTILPRKFGPSGGPYFLGCMIPSWEIWVRVSVSERGGGIFPY